MYLGRSRSGLNKWHENVTNFYTLKNSRFFGRVTILFVFFFLNGGGDQTIPTKTRLTNYSIAGTYINLTYV